MKTCEKPRDTSMKVLLRCSAVVAGLFVAAVAGPAVHGAETRAFATPEAAAAALVEVLRNQDRAGALELLGSENEQWIRSGDAVQDKSDVERFIVAYDKKNGIEKPSDETAVLLVGDDDYPFSIPIVRGDKGWVFDAEQGKEELLSRRIGRNELSTIQTVQAIADAQLEYAEVDRNGNGVMEYAAYIVSSLGERDGLWWPTKDGEPASPLGPLVADAVREGYEPQEAVQSGEPVDESQPYHGYHFKLLTRQGDSAPGGAREYIVGGLVIGGFAVLAYPANYGNTGIMTFIMSQDGIIYDRDLGPATDSLVVEIESFNPGEGWKIVDPSDASLPSEISVSE